MAESVTEWDVFYQPATDMTGVFVRPRSEFSYMVAGGIRISYRNIGYWWSHNTFEVREQAVRLANALGLPVFEIQTDFRRNKPYRWVRIQ